MDRRMFVASGLAFAAGIGLASCYGPGYGPPPHAPAYGHRWRHPSGVALVFDPALGVYTVTGYPYYYLDDHFYRWDGAAWFMSLEPSGPWRRARERSVPPGLRKRFGSGHPGRGRGRR